MAQQSRFFGSSGGDTRQYNQLEFAEVMERFISNGVFADAGNRLAVTEQTPALMGVKVDIGKAYIQGYYYSNTSALNVTLSASDITNPRIDLIILRLDVLATRLITVQVLTGTPAPAPVVPTLTQNSSIYEIALAQVLVPANSTSVVNANITSSSPASAIARNFDQYGIASASKNIDSTNLNNLDLNGFYQGSSLTNAPSPWSAGFVINQKINNVTRKQKFFNNQGNEEYTRYQISGVWQPWKQVAIIETPVWTNLTLQNGATPNGTRIPRYIKYNGIVYLQGEINTVANNTVIATLPAGFRPNLGTGLNFVTAIANSGTMQTSLMGVGSTGAITVFVVSSGSGSPICLNGIQFPADQ